MELGREWTTAVVWGEAPPPHSVGHCSPMWVGDSGLTILMSDSDEVGPGDPRITLEHLSCLVGDLPGLEHGIAIAHERGVADVDDDGRWVVGDASRLEPVQR